MSQNLSQADVQKFIATSPRKHCECGCQYFDTVTVQVEVSASTTGTGKDEILLAGVLICHKCGIENSPRLIKSG